jgi:hypothetical protein
LFRVPEPKPRYDHVDTERGGRASLPEGVLASSIAARHAHQDRYTDGNIYADTNRDTNAHGNTGAVCDTNIDLRAN